MATVVEFECPNCSAGCSAHSRRGEVVRCPHCFSFVTVPQDELPRDESDELPQFKAPPQEPEPEVQRASEPATIVFRCQYCQGRIETDVANAGLPCLCPGCRADMIVPGYAQPIFLPNASRRVPEAPRRPRDDFIAGMIVAMLALAGLWMAINWLRSLM